MPAWKGRFFTIWTGQQLSLFGTTVAQFALVWWLTQRTGSATVLATASLAALLPSVLLGPFAGALVDRWNRRRVMLVADSLIALVSLALALLFWAGKTEVWHIYLVKVVRALGGAFHWPAMTASVSLMVPKEHLSRIAGLNHALNGLRTIVGPSAAALLLTAFPIHLVLGIDVLTAILAVVPLLFVSIPQPGAARDRPPYFRELAQGFRYIWSWRGALYLVLGATLLNALLSPASSLLPLLVTKHFGKGALELGWLESAFGFGVIAGGLLLSAWGGFKRRIYTALLGMAGMGVGVVALGMAPAHRFPLALGAMAWVGLMNPITNGPLMAILQATVAPEIQGRVFSVISSLAEGASPVGLALAGPVADLFGVQVWFLLGGSGLLLMGLGGFFVPSLVRIEEGAVK
ncbi:MAG: MFS transporter [Candidatus Bipolaricaulota bacterium]|nr:MFS transporter [Candidatus Bipolaricaulota bacterium]